MLSFETEDRISKFLLFLSTSHQNIDTIKRDLNALAEFDPFAIFSRIDRSFKGHIDYIDIYQFFNDNMIYITSSEAKSIIAWYDADCDGLLSYGEFLSMIIADEARTLPTGAFNCNCRDIRGTTLSFPVETGVCDLLEKELRFNRFAQENVVDCRCRFDVTVERCFKALGGNANLIQKTGIRTFLIRNKRKFTEKDIDIITNKLDIEKKGRITLFDIDKVFTFFGQYNNNNPNGGIISNSSSEFNTSHNYSKIASLNGKSIDINNTSPLVKTWTSPHSMSTSFNLRPFPAITSPSSLIVDLLEVIYRTEIALESQKCALALRNDFNVDDAFIVFEHNPNPNNELTECDLQTGLNALGLFPTNTELKLLIRKYSLLNTNTLNYGDFFDMLVPFDKDYRNMIERRPSSPFTPKFNRSDFFLGETKKILADLLEKAIVSENKIEIVRKRISKSYTINVREYVMSIDKGRKGFIDVNDIRDFVRDKINKDAKDKECDLMFIRLDRDRDGKVNYDDIIYECREYYYY